MKVSHAPRIHRGFTPTIVRIEREHPSERAKFKLVASERNSELLFEVDLWDNAIDFDVSSYVRTLFKPAQQHVSYELWVEVSDAGWQLVFSATATRQAAQLGEALDLSGSVADILTDFDELVVYDGYPRTASVLSDGQVYVKQAMLPTGIANIPISCEDEELVTGAPTVFTFEDGSTSLSSWITALQQGKEIPIISRMGDEAVPFVVESISEAWITAANSGNTLLQLSIQKNPNESVGRIAQLTLRQPSSGNTLSLQIIQDAFTKKFVFYTQESTLALNHLPEGDMSTTLVISQVSNTNVPFRIDSVVPPWITSAYVIGDRVYVYSQPNDTGTDRATDIVLKQEHTDDTITLSIKQIAQVREVEVFTFDDDSTFKEVSFIADFGKKTLGVISKVGTTNLPFSIKNIKEVPPWLSVSILGNSAVELAPDKNDTLEIRNYTIYFIQDITGNEISIDVSQAAALGDFDDSFNNDFK